MSDKFQYNEKGFFYKQNKKLWFQFMLDEFATGDTNTIYITLFSK